ncbi:hypothetical protein F0562_019768 [Nyssa sinensis]|uniref:Terpene synthase N-terminal domain-containing protein n=1 Tax=Nyssa sinensis TaxID=561372 RepID=A0A5J5BPW9_9ASTE|nr:hypothetical protein F0562_019768 [Nyssa sinensis]
MALRLQPLFSPLLVSSTRKHSLDEEKYTRPADEMKDEVKCLINETTDPLAKLELIDAVQRLGLKYQFETEIKNGVDFVYKNSSDAWLFDDLYATALRFRHLRQHGYNVPQEVFARFKDEMGNFRTQLCEDVKGLLSLYEASFFGLEGETIIDEAKALIHNNKFEEYRGREITKLGQKSWPCFGYAFALEIDKDRG